MDLSKVTPAATKSREGATDKLFAGSIPEMYEKYLVPLIFEPYAIDLAKRIAKLRPQSILEVAAGTGVVTRAIASHTNPSTRVVATDLNEAMIEHAKTLQPKGRAIDWRQADALSLPFEDQKFDVVACQFGAMFFPDKVRAYKEARRVLKAGGCYLFNVWDRIAENEFADVVTETLATLFPEDPPRFLRRTPHGYYDVDTIRAELKSAGFANVSVDAVDETSRAPSPRHPAIAYCQGTPLRNELEARDAARLEEATDRAAEALARKFGEGSIEGRIRAYVITAAA